MSDETAAAAPLLATTTTGNESEASSTSSSLVEVADDDDNDEEQQKQLNSSTLGGGSNNDNNNRGTTSSSSSSFMRSKLQLLDRSLDRWLQNYVRFMSSSTNTDRSLKLLQWTIWLASYVKKSRPLKKLSLDVSYGRYALRFLGLPASVEAVRTNSWSTVPHRAPWLGKIMAWSMVGYYPFEHLAYIGWQSPQLLTSGPPGNRAERWSAWSCRCWLVYIGAELVQSTIRLLDLKRELQQQQQGTTATTTTPLDMSSSSQQQCKDDTTTIRSMDDNKEKETDSSSSVEAATTTTTAAATAATTQASIRYEEYQIVRSLLFVMPAIHWSMSNWHTQPLLNEAVVNILMWTESVVSMIQSLHSFQQQWG